MKKVLQLISLFLTIISFSNTAYSQCFPFPISNACHPLHNGRSYGFNDMDKDGIPELYYGDRKGSTIINKRENDVYNKIGVIPYESGYTNGRGIEFHDFNEDGENEVVTFGAGGIGISSKNSLNGYSAPIFHLWGNSSYIRDYAVVDCNNDGFKEIYGIDGSKKRLYILKNNNGVLGGVDSIQLLGTLKYMAFGDINNDGFNDIVVSADGTNTGFNIIRGGASGYTTSFYNASGVNYRFNIGDLNGDNFPEIVCQQNTSKVAILIFQNNGGTNFTALPSIQLFQDFPSIDADLIVTDFDKDQLLDVVTNSEDSIIMMKGNGAIGFSQIVSIKLSYNGRLFSGDFNSDSILDFASVQGSLDIYLGSDSLHKVKRLVYSSGTGSIDNKSLFDMDGNGLVDIVAGHIAYQTQRGVFEFGPNMGISGSGYPVGDFDGDGLGDLIVRDNLFRLFIGANGFQSGVQPSYTFSQTFVDPRMYVARLNTDTISDLVVVQQLSGIDSVITYLGAANGTFTLGSRFASPAYTMLNPIVKDLNNDGKADIVSASYLASTIRSWRGIGNGGFVAASNISPSNFPTGITVGNIDNLGNDEVVVTEFSGFGSADIEFYTVGSNLQLTLNNSIMFTPYSCSNIKLYDFDKDGFLDLKGGTTQNKNCYYRGTGSLTGFIDDTTLAEPGYYNFPPLYTNPTGYDDFISYSSEYRPAHNNNLSVDAQAPSQACNGKALSVRTDYTGLSTYLWNTGDTTSSIVVSNDGNYFLTINTSPGCSFNSDTITLNFVNCDSVWPGDANRDFIVNQDDLFPITYNYNDSGLTRATLSNVWAPWASSDWYTYFNFNDEKFIDCNGDGAINVFDTVAISQNFSNTYAARPNDVLPQVTGTPQLFLVKIQQGATIGDTVILGLYAGTAGNGFNATNGFSINIVYDGSIVQTGTGNFEFDNNSFLGSRGTDWLSIERISGNAITSAIGIKSGALVNGYGKIAELSFILNQSLTSSYQFNYSISNSSYSGYAGQLLPLDQSSSVITFTTTGLTDITSSNLQILGSNPVLGGQEVVVSVAQFKGILEARWMNMNGQIIDVQRKFANDNFLLLQAPFTPGIYVLQITDGINRGYTKVVVGVGK